MRAPPRQIWANLAFSSASFASKLDRLHQLIDIALRVVGRETHTRGRGNSEMSMQRHRAMMAVTSEHTLLIKQCRKIFRMNTVDSKADNASAML
jgi:hypothetical protein